jgi:cytochrome c-type biogenesis protein CcmH
MLLFLLLSPAAAAAQPSGAPPYEADARRLEQQIVAPCCWRQAVAVHDSEIARQIRQDLRVRLARGETAEHVRDAYVQQYGAAILLEPPARGSALTLYVLPPVILLASGGLLVVLVRRFTRRRTAVDEATPAARMPGAAPNELVRRLDDDLDAMD